MFTGIIEETGVIVGAEPREGGVDFIVGARITLDGLRVGDSVAIDGVCLTATSIGSATFAAHAVGTTLERTTLGGFAAARRVNLERALALGDRLGGHLVQGHVDGVGEVLAIETRDDHVLIDFTLPPAVAEVSIPLGSITVNGISLTINALPAPDRAQVSIIPHTWEVTAMDDLTVGAMVNLEGDLIGKYIRQLVPSRGAHGSEGMVKPVHVAPPEG